MTTSWKTRAVSPPDTFQHGDAVVPRHETRSRIHRERCPECPGGTSPTAVSPPALAQTGPSGWSERSRTT
jgi:hypothetical protein